MEGRMKTNFSLPNGKRKASDAASGVIDFTR